MAVLVGTSGWSYPHWRGPVYPAGLPSRAWLPHIASLFPTVEVNASHYRLPQPRSVANWAALTPAEFRFTCKMWSWVTHRSRLHDCGRLVAMFYEALTPMPHQRRAAVLVQLPPMMHADVQRLSDFLATVRTTPCSDWPLAVEFRHKSWDTPDVRRVLDQNGAAFVLHDMRGSSNDRPNDPEAPGRLVYVRRHGPSGRYRGSYSDEALQADAARIREWHSDGRDVLVYFNNDMRGYAVADALRLQDELRALGVPVFDPGAAPLARIAADAPKADPRGLRRLAWPLARAPTPGVTPARGKRRRSAAPLGSAPRRPPPRRARAPRTRAAPARAGTRRR